MLTLPELTVTMLVLPGAVVSTTLPSTQLDGFEALLSDPPPAQTGLSARSAATPQNAAAVSRARHDQEGQNRGMNQSGLMHHFALGRTLKCKSCATGGAIGKSPMAGELSGHSRVRAVPKDDARLGLQPPIGSDVCRSLR